MDILNKSYKRKNATDSDVFIIDKIDGDFVVFTNGARCKQDTLLNDFVDVTLNENISTDITPNAETFFNTPAVDDTLLQQLEKIHTNPNATITPSNRLQESVSLDDNKQYEKVSPNGFVNGLTDEQSNETIPQVKSNRLPEWDVFDNVKLSEEIEITVPFKIKLPRPEKIDILNDMFKTSFTAYLSKKYINENIINNSAKLQMMIQKSIEDWMNTELSNIPKKKQPKRSKHTKVEPVIDIKPTVNINNTSRQVDTNDNASTFFGINNQGPKWDGNIKKLFVISSDEQYNAVKNEYIKLKDNNSNNPDIDRYEDMLQTYEDQLK